MRMNQVQERGMTLIEMVVGTAIASLLIVSAIAFASHETQLMGISRARVNSHQDARNAMALLVADLTAAGQGIARDDQGNFAGFFAPADGNSASPVDSDGYFRGLSQGGGSPARGEALGLVTYVGAGQVPSVACARKGPGAAEVFTPLRPSSSLAIRMATGHFATICNADTTSLVVCLPAGSGDQANPFEANDERLSEYGAVLTNERRDAFQLVTISNPQFGQGSCLAYEGGGAGSQEGYRDCAHGRIQLSYAAITGGTDGMSTRLEPNELLSGEIATGFRTVLWSVENGDLFRTEFVNGHKPVSSDDATCTDSGVCRARVAANVDYLSAQIFHLEGEGTAAQWVIGRPPNGERRPLRVDVEVVVNTGMETDNEARTRVRLADGTLFPPQDECRNTQVERRLVQNSVYLLNATRD